MADEVMAAMETALGAYAPLPGLVSIPAVTPEQLGHLYHLAAQLYQASPWAWFHDHHPFAITCPPEDAPRYAIVMGSGGEVFGLAVYDRLATCERCSRRRGCRGRGPGGAPGPCCFSKRPRR